MNGIKGAVHPECPLISAESHLPPVSLSGSGLIAAEMDAATRLPLYKHPPRRVVFLNAQRHFGPTQLFCPQENLDAVTSLHQTLIFIREGCWLCLAMGPFAPAEEQQTIHSEPVMRISENNELLN